MDVLITGDSHTAALFKGLNSLKADGGWPDGVRLSIRPMGGGHLTREPFFFDRGDHVEITTPEYRRNFSRLPIPELDGVDTIYGISAPLHSVRIWRHPGWRKFAPNGRQFLGIPVSSGMIRQVILDDQQYVLQLLAILLRNGKRVFVIEPPHPFRHHPALRVAPPQLVHHLNLVYRSHIRCALVEMGVPIVSVPDHCVEDGFMSDAYAQPDDHHHGNLRYGRLMMEQVLLFLREHSVKWENAKLPRVSAS